MTPFVVILAALQLAVPVRCYETPAAWRAQLAHVQMPPVVAYYDPTGPTPHIALGAWACRQVRTPTLEGATVLAHELAHAWQHSSGRMFDEREADSIGAWAGPGILRRLERFFHRRAPAVVELRG